MPDFRTGEDEQSAGERKAFGTAAKDETVTGEEVSAGESDTDAPILPGQDTLSGAYGNTTWTIDAAGKLTVKGTGNAYGADEYGDQNPQWLSYSDQIITAEVDLTGVTDLHNFFLGCNKLKSVDLKMS